MSTILALESLLNLRLNPYGNASIAMFFSHAHDVVL